jgi:2-methylcitrate dehydratase PrpD
MTADPSQQQLEPAVAEYCASFSIEDVPEPVRERARLVLLDTLGVCLYGATTPDVAATADAYASIGSGPVAADSDGATLFATGERYPPAVAALTNAGGGTSQELDEGNQRSGHTGIHAVPTAVALAEHLHASGTDLLEAVVLAYEVGARFGDVNRPLVSDLHPHGEWAAIAAAVAAGSMLDFDAAEYREAIRIAANPFVAAHWAAATEGATVRNYYTGITCRHGIDAALLARGDVTGIEDAVSRSLLEYTAAEDLGPDQLDAVFSSLGEEYYLETSYFKMHAACRYTHAPIEATNAVLDAVDFDEEDVERITVRTFEAGTRLDDPNPTNALSGKFSLPYVIATLIRHGTSDVDAFTDERLADEATADLAARVEIVQDDVFESRASDGLWGAAIEIELVDGRTVERTVEDARGGGDNPFTREEVVGKFRRLVGTAYDDKAAAALHDRIFDVTSLDDAARLFDVLD